MEINTDKSKRTERWVMYASYIDANNITSDRYLWMHHTIDRSPDKRGRVIHAKTSRT